MASEKRTSVTFSTVKDGLTQQLAISRTEDMTGTNRISVVQTISTASYQAVLVTGLSASDLIALQNNDAVNYISISHDGTNEHQRFSAGRGTVVIRPGGDGSGTVYAKANTAACDLSVVAVEP